MHSINQHSSIKPRACDTPLAIRMPMPATSRRPVAALSTIAPGDGSVSAHHSLPMSSSSKRSLGGGARILPPEVNRILYVRNLPFKISAAELYDIFGAHGAVRQIRLGVAPGTRGTAYVVYEDIYDAKAAVERLSGFNVAGRYLIVRYWTWDCWSGGAARPDSSFFRTKSMSRLLCLHRVRVSLVLAWFM